MATQHSLAAMNPEIRTLTLRVADQLARVDGVVAVVVGGSQASGLSEADSDLDLGIFYDPVHVPSMSAFRRIGAALQGGDVCQIAPPGDWGPWMNGGGWLEVDGVRVDWIFRDLSRVRQVFDDCISGQVSCDYYLGYPHGFHNYYYLAEVHHCKVVFDPDDVVGALAQRLIPFPEKIRQAIIEKYLYDAGFMLDGGESSARRGDVLHAVGCLFRCAAALVQVVFALNECFTMNEKKSLRVARKFSIQPTCFGPRIETLLGRSGWEDSEMQQTYGLMRNLLKETRELAPPLSYSWPP